MIISSRRLCGWQGDWAYREASCNLMQLLKSLTKTKRLAFVSDWMPCMQQIRSLHKSIRS